MERGWCWYYFFLIALGSACIYCSVFADAVVWLALSSLLPKFHFMSVFYCIWYVLPSSQGCIPLPGIWQYMFSIFSPGAQVSSCASTFKVSTIICCLNFWGLLLQIPVFPQQPSSFFNISNILLAHPCYPLVLGSLDFSLYKTNDPLENLCVYIYR